jgi:hypothetical protein
MMDAKEYPNGHAQPDERPPGETIFGGIFRGEFHRKQ